MVDNSFDNISVVDREVLDTLVYSNSVSGVARKLGKRRSNVCRSLKKLVKAGLVTMNNGLYYISSSGVIKSVETPNGLITPPRDKLQRVELHDVSFEVYFWGRPPVGWGEFRRGMFKLPVVRDFRFNDKFRGGGIATMVIDDFTVSCTSRGIIVFLPAVVADSPREATLRVFNVFVGFVRRLERHLRLPVESLYKDGRLNVRLHTAHYAFLRHEFARWWVDEGKSTRFIVEDEEGRLRVWIDFSSPGFPHLEALTAEFGEQDASFVQEYFRPVLRGDFMTPDVVQSSIRGLARNMSGLEPVLADLNANLRSHVKLTKEVAAAASSLNAAMGVLRRRSVQVKGNQEVLWRWFK